MGLVGFPAWPEKEQFHQWKKLEPLLLYKIIIIIIILKFLAMWKPSSVKLSLQAPRTREQSHSHDSECICLELQNRREKKNYEGSPRVVGLSTLPNQFGTSGWDAKLPFTVLKRVTGRRRLRWDLSYQESWTTSRLDNSRMHFAASHRPEEKACGSRCEGVWHIGGHQN